MSSQPPLIKRKRGPDWTCVAGKQDFVRTHYPAPSHGSLPHWVNGYGRKVRRPARPLSGNNKRGRRGEQPEALKIGCCCYLTLPPSAARGPPCPQFETKKILIGGGQRREKRPRTDDERENTPQSTTGVQAARPGKRPLTRHL